jgi:hypothetical protein
MWELEPGFWELHQLRVAVFVSWLKGGRESTGSMLPQKRNTSASLEGRVNYLSFNGNFLQFNTFRHGVG